MSFTAKHLLNSPETLVVDSLRGLCDSNPWVALDAEHKVIIQATIDRSKVALVCGGGSGHEPAHASFVGDGILTAAVCGNVFASPNASQVKRAIQLVDGEKGTLIIIKNYTGDILNFGLAQEQYLATHPDKAVQVKFLVVGDDVSVGRTQGGLVGRRGLAGTVLVYKIAGALAQRGASLEEVYETARAVSERLGTVGVGLAHCHVPGSGRSEGYLADNEIEIGMGIHNEPGHQRLSPIPPNSILIPSLIDMVISTTDQERSFLPFGPQGSGDEVVLMVNNLGGLSELELGSVVGEAVACLERRGIGVARVLCGTFMTSLNMPGFSLTLLLLPRATEKTAVNAATILDLLDTPSNAPGWRWSTAPRAPHAPGTPTDIAAPDTERGGQDRLIAASDPRSFKAAIKAACEALVSAEPEITRLDTIAGDGDCGFTLRNGAHGVLQKIEQGAINGNDVVGSIILVAQVAEECMDGTSGALYSIFFSSLAQGLQMEKHATIESQSWIRACTFALDKLYSYTPARAPSRTLVDPLHGFVAALSEGKSFQEAVAAAVAAAEHTKELPARAGRATYVEQSRLRGVPDAGAIGVQVLLEAVAAVLRS